VENLTLDNTESLVQSMTWTVPDNAGPPPERPVSGTNTDVPDPAVDETPKVHPGGRISPSMWLLGVASAIVVVAVVTILFWPKPVQLEPRIAQATVLVEPTPLLQEPRPNSRGILVLHKGQRVNVLERIPPKGSFVRVQFVSPKKNSLPGFVGVDRLSEWSSEDAGFSLDIVRMKRPPAGAGTQDWVNYAEQLLDFARRFPGLKEADQARLEAAEIYRRIATELKNAGKPYEESVVYLDRAEAALKDITQDDTGAVAESRRFIAELRQVDPGPDPKKDETAQRLEKMYVNAAQMWTKGEPSEKVFAVIEEILRIDPHYDHAIRLRDQIKREEGVFKK
jgi:hypothetical protein